MATGLEANRNLINCSTFVVCRTLSNYDYSYTVFITLLFILLYFLYPCETPTTVFISISTFTPIVQIDRLGISVSTATLYSIVFPSSTPSDVKTMSVNKASDPSILLMVYVNTKLLSVLPLVGLLADTVFCLFPNPTTVKAPQILLVKKGFEHAVRNLIEVLHQISPMDVVYFDNDPLIKLLTFTTNFKCFFKLNSTRKVFSSMYGMNSDKCT